ncbi:CACNA1G, partial [Symbiodinium sp. CCMP2456]
LEEPSNLKYFGSLGINASEARGLFGLLDADESGSVSLQEFMQGCLRLRGQAKAIDMATLMYQNKRIVFWLQDRLERLEGSLRPTENDGKVVPHKKNDSMSKVGPVVKTWMELTNEHMSGRRRGSSK